MYQLKKNPSHQLWFLQRTSVTVTLVGIGKSVSVANCRGEFQYKRVLFGEKKLSLWAFVTVTDNIVTDVLCSRQKG